MLFSFSFNFRMAIYPHHTPQAFPPFSLFDGLSQGAGGIKIVEVNVFGLALVALTSDWRVLVVDNLGNIGMHGMYLTSFS
jgi:hypothetical protein